MRLPASLNAPLATMVVAFAASSAAAAQPVKTVHVDCTAGKSISKALERGDERKPLLIVVRGICNESVNIERDDVTLYTDSTLGGGVHGPDASVNTVTVAANRVTIEGMTISGGRNGITGIGAGGLTVRNTIVNSGRTGIAYSSGSSGVIDGCTVRLNPRDGVVVESSSATIINSTIGENTRFGIQGALGAAMRIGIANNNAAAGNTISQNGSSGIAIVDGSAALIAMNMITSNGTDPTAPTGRAGISVVQGTADIVGGNTISGHPGQGVFARGSAVVIGNPGVVSLPVGGSTSLNTITENGNAASSGGVFGFLGSTFVVRDAVISRNGGGGLVLSLRSSAQLLQSTITDNLTVPAPPAPFFILGDGIRLQAGSALLATLAPGSSAPSTVSSGMDPAALSVRCQDTESSAATQPASALVIIGNPPNCTGY